jgi:hypothetical protein
MAREDKYAFDAMNAIDPDMNVTGGAIEYSSYEMDMSPSEQKGYEENLKSALSISYRSDPHKGELSFQNWLKGLRPDLVMERARKWEEIREDTKGVDEYRSRMDALGLEESNLLEDSGILQRLLNKHTGRLEDVYDMVGDYSPEPLEEAKISKSEYRR